MNSEEEMGKPNYVQLIMKLFSGPALYKRYRTPEVPSRIYAANFLEAKSDTVLWAASVLKTFGIVLSPILLPYLYRRGFFSADNSLRVGLFISLVYGGAMFVRGVGRLFNEDYKQFLRILEAANRTSTPFNVRRLREFDFEFWAWPVNYKWNDLTPEGESVRARRFIQPAMEVKPEEGFLWRQIKSGLSWFAANTFGGWLLYPGSLKIFNVLVRWGRWTTLKTP